MKGVYCFNRLPWAFSGRSHWEVLPEISLIQKTLRFYISWVHWKNQCRSTVREHAKHEYQHSAQILVKNIFNPFHGTDIFLYFLKYIIKPKVSWCFQEVLKDSSAIKWVNNHFIFIYLFCYLLSNWKTSYTMKLLILLI